MSDANATQHSVLDLAIDYYNGSHLGKHSVIGYPWLIAAVVAALLCVVTRIVTSRQPDLNPSLKRGNKAENPDVPRLVPTQPYWIPWLGHAIPMGLSYQSYLTKVSSKTESRIYAVVAGGSKVNIVTSPSLTKQVLDKVGLPLTMEPLVWYILKNFFGDKGDCEDMAKQHQDFFWSEIHRPLFLMQRDPWLGKATDRVAKAVGENVYNMVSGNESWVDQERWERLSRTELIEGNGSGEFVAVTDLHQLVRNWVGNIASTLLMGHAFMDNNPEALEDLWLFDSRIMKFFLGLPSLLVPGLPVAASARERLITAVKEQHKAMLKVQQGQDPGSRYDDLSDVPDFLWDRVSAMHKLGAKDRSFGALDLVVFWAMNVNANQVVSWMLFYLHSNPDILAEVREEIKPFVTVRKTDSGLLIKESPKLDIDAMALANKCPLLKATFYETMRLEVEATAFRKITADCTIKESEEDAKLSGRFEPATFLLKKGETVLVPAAVHQSDPIYWPEPERFNPKRFFETVQGEKSANTTRVTMKSLRSFGGGKTMCKGRFFAEREVLIFVAGIISTWEMGLDDLSMLAEDNKWKHPGRITTSATTNPRKSLRVRMWRRKM